MRKEILRMQDVSAGDYEPLGLNGFHLFLRQGELVKLLGLSGSGKTMLYQFFQGHTVLKKGWVQYGNKTFHTGECFAATANVAGIGQESTLVPDMSVAENIFIINRRRKQKHLVWMKGVNYRAGMLLAQYAPDIEPTTPVRNLSTVQKRIVELLRAMESEAGFLIIDDAFDGMGRNDIRKITELLQVLREKGMAILYESQELNFVDRLADRVILLRKGRNIRTFYARDFDETFCMRLLTGDEGLPVFERKSVATEQVVMQLQGVTGRQYVRDLSLDLHQGEIVGLYDLNNHGNLELLDLMVGRGRKYAGRMFLQGQQYEPRDLDDAVSHNICFYQGNTHHDDLVEELSVQDNLCLPIQERITYPGGFRNRKAEQYLSRECMQRMGVPPGAEKGSIRGFEEWNQKRILMERWILTRPAVMACREPFVGIDVMLRDAMMKTLSELAGNHSAVLIASQDINELKMICDTIYSLDSDSNQSVTCYRMSK